MKQGMIGISKIDCSMMRTISTTIEFVSRIKKPSVRNRWIFLTALAALVCFSMSFYGCMKKKLNDMKARPSPDWVKNAVLYEIDLRTYAKGEAFKSLSACLPDLKKLGFTMIVCPPVHPVGELNRKGIAGNPEAVKDFYEVNSEFGTMEEFKSLVKTAHQQGLKIIITLVLNQAAWDSQLLTEHPDWFVHNEEGALLHRTQNRLMLHSSISIGTSCGNICWR